MTTWTQVGKLKPATAVPYRCLGYVRKRLGAPAKYLTATSARQHVKRMHKDQDFPPGVAVPLWFTDAQDPRGHVALRHPDGSITSTYTPTQPKLIVASIAELQRHWGKNRLTYIGWSEDINGKTIITKGKS